MRSREYGALFVPVECEADKFVFDLLDCVCEIVYDAALFDTFPQVKIMYEGVVVCVGHPTSPNETNSLSALRDGLVIAAFIQS